MTLPDCIMAAELAYDDACKKAGIAPDPKIHDHFRHLSNVAYTVEELCRRRDLACDVIARNDMTNADLEAMARQYQGIE